MSIKTIAIIIIVSSIFLGLGAWWIKTASFDAGVVSRDKTCVTERAADATKVLQASAVANAAGAKAQKEEDARELAETKLQLNAAMDSAAISQRVASESKAKADQLNSTLERLRNENKDVRTWSDTCLSPALIASLHPQGSGQADSGCPR